MRSMASSRPETEYIDDDRSKSILSQANDAKSSAGETHYTW